MVWTESDDGITGSEGTKKCKAGASGRGADAQRYDFRNEIPDHPTTDLSWPVTNPDVLALVPELMQPPR